MKIKVSNKTYAAINNIHHLANLGIIFYIIGTCGSFENDAIDTKTFFIRIALSLILLFLGR